MRRLPLVVPLLLLMGCPSYSYRRGGTAPHYAPGNRNGRPMDREAEMSFASMSDLNGGPSPATADSALGVASRHFSATVRASRWYGWDAGFIWDQGLGQSAARGTAADTPDPGDDDVWAPGFTFYSASERSTGFTMGGEIQGLLYVMPYVVYRECNADCLPAEPLTETRHGRAVAPVAAFTLTPAWHGGPVSLFGSVSMRNHLNIRRNDMDAGVDTGVDLGPMMLSVGAGVEVSVPPGFRIGVQLFQVFGADPIFGVPPSEYGPSISVWVTVPFSPRAPEVKPKKPKKAAEAVEENDFERRRPRRRVPLPPRPEPRPVRPPLPEQPPIK